MESKEGYQRIYVGIHVGMHVGILVCLKYLHHKAVLKWPSETRHAALAGWLAGWLTHVTGGHPPLLTGFLKIGADQLRALCSRPLSPTHFSALILTPPPTPQHHYHVRPHSRARARSRCSAK